MNRNGEWLSETTSDGGVDEEETRKVEGEAVKTKQTFISFKFSHIKLSVFLHRFRCRIFFSLFC